MKREVLRTGLRGNNLLRVRKIHEICVTMEIVFKGGFPLSCDSVMLKNNHD